MKDDVILYYFKKINDEYPQKIEGYSITLLVSTPLKEKYRLILDAENSCDFKKWLSHNTVNIVESFKLKYRKVIALKEFLS